ncbi:3' terminal RNA ribose 2'-O-methyltransferase Hen1 [Pendulispora rubella]|uniref:Small RNA 2'-O-methyltransferase n=1 Tax=Pendulispora rubella TaxID=2741070 RepID=A0ABZ2KVD9_9BACT
MLLTISTNDPGLRPATDLGYLLGKNPERVQSFELGFGQAHVFYPVACAEQCTVALLLDVDPVRLARRPAERDGYVPLEPYVNDRPYVASSFLSVAMAQVFGSALGGRSRERPERAVQALAFEARLESLPCRGGRMLVEKLFAPLGYAVEVERLPLDSRFPAWGDGPYHRVRLRGAVRLGELLSHLYVLIPVLDDEKHYWVGDDEVEKLVRKGEGWLATHPERDLIAYRYLRHQRVLVRNALERLSIDEGAPPDAADAEAAAAEEAVEKRLRLDQVRIEAVVAELRALGAHSVIDLGCGEGKLLRALFREKAFARLAGVDVSLRALEIARQRLERDRNDRIVLMQGALTYRDERFRGFDAAALVEVIEHVDPSRLGALEGVVFGDARPGSVIVTTPNVEYNVLFESLPAGRHRHADHRFEWTRDEFAAWVSRTAAVHGYAASIRGIGGEHPMHGAPTQMAVFRRAGGEGA